MRYFKPLCHLVLGSMAFLAGCSPLASSATPALLVPPTAISVQAVTPLPGAPGEFKIGIILFLTGGAARPFGIPAQNGAHVMIDAINRGLAPVPYDRPGMAGVPITAVYVDESGGTEKQVDELRRLFQQEKVDLVIGYISSGDCLAIAPVAEKLQKLTVVFDCGTSRLFEEQDYHYVFRTNAHQAIDSIGGARYLLDVEPDIHSIAGINQNYSWGQDSWAHFRDSMLKLKPDIAVLDEEFPKLDAGVYSSEIAALKLAWPEVIHTSFWGADLEEFVLQAERANLLDASRLLMSVGESDLPDLGEHVPARTIIGAHGPHGVLAPSNELNDWMVKIYRERYDARPAYPVYHMAQAILGVKMAFEKAARAQGTWPTTEQVIQAFEYLEFPSPSGDIQMSLGKGHQAVEEAVYGTAGTYNPALKEVEITRIIRYPVRCVNPPQDMTTEQWIREGFPGNDCP
jgi:branched-chain amino acid transport system substrate-binding protein